MTKGGFQESCFQFGRQRQLTGIVTAPSAAAPRKAFVLVTAGLIPKFGPFRLYAQLARRLASEGFLTLRFDLGGVGDSGQEYTGEPLKKRTELEIRAALDYLSEHYQLDGIVVGGLCSGAEDAFRYAELDPRVTGVMMIDPFAYKSSGWRWRHLRHRLARRALRLLGLYAPYTAADMGPALVNYKNMDFVESSRILRAMLKRKARIHFVYTGGMDGPFNHRRQLKAMFGEIEFAGLVTLDYFPQMGHTQMLGGDRRTLVEAIARQFGA